MRRRTVLLLAGAAVFSLGQSAPALAQEGGAVVATALEDVLARVVAPDDEQVRPIGFQPASLFPANESPLPDLSGLGALDGQTNERLARYLFSVMFGYNLEFEEAYAAILAAYLLSTPLFGQQFLLALEVQRYLVDGFSILRIQPGVMVMLAHQALTKALLPYVRASLVAERSSVSSVSNSTQNELGLAFALGAVYALSGAWGLAANLEVARIAGATQIAFAFGVVWGMGVFSGG